MVSTHTFTELRDQTSAGMRRVGLVLGLTSKQGATDDECFTATSNFTQLEVNLAREAFELRVKAASNIGKEDVVYLICNFASIL